MKRWRTDAFARRGFIAAALAVCAVAGLQRDSCAESPALDPAILSRAKLERVGDYIRNEIATGKIPGAIMLIQQRGKPVYSIFNPEFFP